MNDVIRMLIKRRTIRKYLPDQIKEQELNCIVEAGLHAPNAGGGQSAIIVVCQDAALNKELGNISRNTEKNIGPNATPVSAEQPSIRDNPNITNGFYNAPTVITLFAKKDAYNLIGDCFVAAENMIIAAQSLGIGSCIVGRAPETFATVQGKKIQAGWGISEEYEAKLHLTLGYPEGVEPKYKKRKEGRVLRF